MSNPTQAIFTPSGSNIDNSPITPGEIAKYVLAVGAVAVPPAAQTYPVSFTDLNVAPAVDGTISVPLASLGVLVPGTYAGVVTAITVAGVSSAQSASATFVIAAPVITPNAPTGLKFV